MQSHTAAQARFFSNRQRYCELVDLYETNYACLCQLLPDISKLGDYAVSTVNQGMDMHYRLLQRCKYTLTFSLSYLFESPEELGYEPVRLPDLQIRMYLDLQLAEVISGVLHRHYFHQNQTEPAVDTLMIQSDMNRMYACWKLNKFLYRWLGFCLKQGHVFRPNFSLRQMQAQLFSKWRII